MIPARDAQFHCLPAEPKRLEGLDYTLAILDEAGVANRDSYEVLTLAQGKRERSTLVAIGTPGANLEDQVLLDLRAYAAEHPDDLSLVWREFSAAGFEDHPPDCAHCWELANRRWTTFCTATPYTPCCRRRPVSRRSGEPACASRPPTPRDSSYPPRCGTGCPQATVSRTAPGW